MKKNILLIIVSYTLNIVVGTATSISITADPFPFSKSLPSTSVNRFYQDKQGFIWLGTLDGLCRFDGYRLLTFRSDIKNLNLLTNNEITSIAEDNANMLLVGTKKGLNLLDKRNYKIQSVNIPDLRDVEIRTISVTTNGEIWIGTKLHVIQLNKDYTLKKRYDSLPFTSVNTIYEDGEGNIWIGLWREGIFRYDRAKDDFVRLEKIGNTNNPFRFFQDKDKNIWIGTWGDGIFLLKRENTNYSYKKIEIENYSIAENDNQFFSITQDEKYGYLWFVSTYGLHAFKLTENETFYKVDISKVLKKTSNIFSEISQDNQGNLWICTFGDGVITINFEKPIIKNFDLSYIKQKTGLNPSITALYKDDNTIWFNQNRFGLGLFDIATGNAELFPEIAHISQLKGLELVNCISSFRAIPNEIWVSVSNYPFIYSLKKTDKNIILNYTINLQNVDTAAYKPANLFFEDRKNNIWIVAGDKIFIRRYSIGKIEQFNIPIKSTISGIAEDTKGDIWLSTSSDGIYRLTVTGNTINKSIVKLYNKDNSQLPSNNIETVCADIQGHVWIGTKEGYVIKYSVLNEKFEVQNILSESINENVLNIIADDFSQLWITTKKRVLEYNQENKAIKEYSTEDGVIINSFQKNSFFKSSLGNLFFGGNNGISVFSPSVDMSDSLTSVKILITDVKINNKSVFFGNNKCFDVVAQEIVFEPDDKNIEINFSSLNYAFSKKIRYAYKMSGIDNDWVYTEGRQFAIYNNLKTGKYQFQLKATDEKGLWSPNITTIEVIKKPEFYETWWAYCLYLILILTVIYFLYSITRRRIHLRNELKIATIEREKSEELIQAKLKYFTNISHDFMTPLTIVSCLIDDAEMTSKSEISQFGAMRSNIQRLRRLLQQVLDFRKVESGNMKLKLSYGDILLFVRDICMTHFEPLFKKKNIDFTFATTETQVQAFFDPDKIDKIIFNLLSNAHKYTPERGKVLLELILVDERILKINLSDTGIGISKETKDKIFTRFYTNENRNIKDSNGIGLSLTKDLIEIHHGIIDVESEVDKGTTFTVEIPIDKDSYSAIEIGNSNLLDINEDAIVITKQSETVIKPLDKELSLEAEKTDINVLLVEDNEELLKVISNILSKHYTIYTATNGLEALDIIKEKEIDIIVSDVMMPQMDGLSLSRKLKTDLETSNIPILLLTAKNSAEDRIECYKAGADGYISKPFDLNVLEARIDNFISHKKAKQKEFNSNIEINISTLEYSSVDEQFLNKAIKFIEDNLSDSELDVNSLAEKLNVSKSSLYRKIKTMIGLAPNEFIRNIRLKHACKMLRNQSVSISEVAYAVGFSDPKYFTNCFKGEFDIAPRDYQKSSLSSEENFEDV